MLDEKYLPQVPQFKWHIVEANRPFVVGDTGVEVTPFIGKS